MTELLGDRIKRLRTARRMSKTALGKAMGLSRVAITKWEVKAYLGENTPI